MVWTIDYTDTGKTQLSKLEKQSVKRILDFMDERVVGRDDPRNTGKALTGSVGSLWRYRVGEVIFEIQDGALRILVMQLGSRREVYR